MFDCDYLKDLEEWIEGHRKWEAGEDEYRKKYPEYRYYAQWEGDPPDVEYYRPPWSKEEATWYQVYETVSEGTPVTPPFETQQELIDYLVKNGDFWDQKRREEGKFDLDCQPWSREQAEKFVLGSGWAPSFVIQGGKVMTGVQAL